MDMPNIPSNTKCMQLTVRNRITKLTNRPFIVKVSPISEEELEEKVAGGILPIWIMDGFGNITNGYIRCTVSEHKLPSATSKKQESLVSIDGDSLIRALMSITKKIVDLNLEELSRVVRYTSGDQLSKEVNEYNYNDFIYKIVNNTLDILDIYKKYNKTQYKSIVNKYKQHDTIPIFIFSGLYVRSGSIYDAVFINNLESDSKNMEFGITYGLYVENLTSYRIDVGGRYVLKDCE